MMKSKSPAANFSSPVMARMAVIFFIAFLASYIATPIHSPIIFEHLTIGNWILENHTVPRQELWSSLAEQTPWRVTSWGFDLLLAATETLFGETGLFFLKLGLLTVFVSCSVLVFSYWAKDRFFGCLLALMVSCGALLNAELEPSTAAAVLFLLTIHQTLRFKQSPSTKNLLYGVALVAVYANIHRSFLICLVASALLLLKDSNELPLENKSLGPNRVICVLLLLLAVCLSPYFGLQTATAALESYNFCWLEFNYRINAGTIYSFPIAFLILQLILLALLWHQRPQALRWTEAFLLGASVVLALGSELTTPFALLISGLCLALVWGRSNGQGLGNLGQSFSELRSTLIKLPATGVLWVLLCLVIVNLTKLWRMPRNEAFLPVREVDYFIDQKFPPPLFHESLVGSYLMYRFAARDGTAKIPIVTSPRARLIVPELAAEQIVFERLGFGWQNYLNRVQANSILCRTDSPLFSLLSIDVSWELRMVDGRPLLLTGASLEAFPRFSWALFVKRQTLAIEVEQQ